MNTIQVEVVTPERKVYTGDVTMVIAKGVDGELGVQAGHVPIVTPLKVGVLRVKTTNGEQSIAVSGGFLEVRPDKVTVLAEAAELPEDIDVARAQASKELAEKLLAALESSRESDTAKVKAEIEVQKAAIKRAEMRLTVAKGKK
ncbi:ATP synthase F1 subunit epsilon [Bacillus horti]|uniref:ATP synthase epsilon chain n=1 Tax=Caldalkalibacillus horti TaxID=77523 RepID=A0ABT9VZN4_9BACI|nr:ATP synthase F1 subunit epsilon [Bacillus horti]MDQ0166462.1 F-type H+-transporting ATPase subunit epsilon [Bacillus horti]